MAAPGSNVVSLAQGTMAASVDCVIKVTVQGVAAGPLTNTATVSVGNGTITGTSSTAPLSVGIPFGDSYQIRYASNLNAGDSFIDFTNTGSSNSNICANVYTYSPDEQLISCCSCLVTPNGLTSLSAVNDLTGNTLTPVRPSSVVVKVVATIGTTQSACNAATVTGAGLAPGLAAWGSTLHSLPSGSFGVVGTSFARGSLSAAELTRMTQLCAFIHANGSGYGICKSCRVGGLGANTK